MKTLLLNTLILLSIALPSSVNAQLVNCQAAFTATVNPSANAVLFTNTSVGNYTNQTWNFGDGTSTNANNPTHIYNITGKVTVCLIIWNTNGTCQSSFCDSVVLGTSTSSCFASFSYQSTGNTFNFYGFSSNPAPAVYYSWTFGDGDSALGQFPSHNYNAPGTYLVCLTAFDAITGCTDTHCQSVVVSPPPTCQANFTSNNLNGASNTATFISSYVSNTAQYNWAFSDGTTGTGHTISHAFLTAGWHTACLTVNDPVLNCSATHCDSIQFNNGTGCQASFTYNVNPGLLSSVHFTSVSNNNIISWEWVFGDGDSSTQQNPVHTYAQAGSYNVCLTISNPATNCNNTICHVVNITSSTGQCNAFFGHQASGNNYYFYNNSSAYSNYWSFGDGTQSFQPNPSHTYGAPGSYLVCHTVHDSLQTCSSTYCDSIHIIPSSNCVASFIFTVDPTGYLFAFTNTSAGILGTISWSFGDGTGSNNNNPSHQYTAPGPHIVCLSIVDPATANILCSFCHTIIAGSSATNCIPVFYSYPDSNAVGNGNVHFGIYNPCTNTQFVWNYGDGTTGSGHNPSHMYSDSGWYYVCVTAFAPSGNYTICDSVFAFRFATGITENGNSFGLVVYPNPLAGNGNAEFTLAGNAYVKATLQDVQGRIIATPANEIFSAGKHVININSNGLENGIYLLQLNINNVIIHKQISIVN